MHGSSEPDLRNWKSPARLADAGQKRKHGVISLTVERWLRRGP
ncbi:hypothetical protein [Bordetella pertussis]|nr:hypothetical protein [Bordetella pertussis]